MLTLENVSVNYGAIEALTDISLTVNQGEVVTLIGANGAGKTTTLRTITSLLQPRSGRVMYEGKEISGVASHRLLPMGIAMSPEGRGVFANLSVRENLEMGAYIRKDKKGIADDMERGFTMFPRMKERESQKAGTLSGGEQQMLAMARALMSRPRLLLLDEPSAGLSPVLVDRVLLVLARLREAGTAVLLVEQAVEKSLAVADRVYALAQGRIVLDSPAQAPGLAARLEHAYLGAAA